ncbi:MAG: RNA polymerase sigma factor [Bacteroidales bacterium]
MQNKEAIFKAVYTQAKEKVYRLCLGFTGNRADADDLLQEIFVKVWNNLENFRHESNIQTWIYRIATNTALLYVTRRDRQKQRVNEFEQNASVLHIDDNQQEQEQQINRLYEAINALKKIDRIIISLLLDDCSYSEIADITGLSATNVGVKISRIKKVLFKKMNDGSIN